MKLSQELKDDFKLFGMEVLEIFTRTAQPCSWVLGWVFAAIVGIFALLWLITYVTGVYVRPVDRPHPLVIIGFGLVAIVICAVVYRAMAVVNKRFDSIQEEKERLFQEFTTPSGRQHAIRQYIRAYWGKK